MDFPERFLLGPDWSDTEYETRRHTGFFWLIGWLTFFFFGWQILQPDQIRNWMALAPSLAVILFFFLLLTTPFLSRYYYRFNIAYKIPALLIQAIKYMLILYSLVGFALQRVQLDRSNLPEDLLDYINQTIESSSHLFAGWDKGLGMLFGIIAGGLRIALTFIFGLLALTILPALLIFLARLLQQFIDWLVHRFIYQEQE